MKSTLPEFHEKYSEFEIFLVAASWCSGKARRRSAEEAQKRHHQQRRMRINIKKKTTKDSLTTNVPPTSMINVDDCVLSRGAIIEPVAVGSRRCVEPLLHDRGDGHNHN